MEKTWGHGNGPMVYLVGAGPGNKKLITIKGLECIQKSDVIVYDRLVNEGLLSYAQPQAEIIYAGKSPKGHTLPQEEINRLLVRKALENKIVTRLKGGDPFVFGRGGEEAEALLEFNIPFEVVPGVSSAIAVPAYAGIPLTHRSYTSGFAVFTGNEHTSKDHSSIEWDKIATGIGTLIFLMGMGNLPLITAKLIENGRSSQTPVAVIRWGSLPDQEVLMGNLQNIGDMVRTHNMNNPATIIVGDVVGLRDKLQWFESNPLFGKRIVVMGAPGQVESIADRIENLGGDPWQVPIPSSSTLIDTKGEKYTPTESRNQALIEEMLRARSVQGIIFLNAASIEYFLTQTENFSDLLDKVTVVCCGGQTYQTAREGNLRVDLSVADASLWELPYVLVDYWQMGEIRLGV